MTQLPETGGRFELDGKGNLKPAAPDSAPKPEPDEPAAVPAPKKE